MHIAIRVYTCVYARAYMRVTAERDAGNKHPDLQIPVYKTEKRKGRKNAKSLGVGLRDRLVSTWMRPAYPQREKSMEMLGKRKGKTMGYDEFMLEQGMETPSTSGIATGKLAGAKHARQNVANDESTCFATQGSQKDPSTSLRFA